MRGSSGGGLILSRRIAPETGITWARTLEHASGMN